MDFSSKKNHVAYLSAVDIIEKHVYNNLKPIGFHKYGRTLHRFVDKDISQVVHFQNGCPGKGVYDILWVNLGIRVPECAERSFEIMDPQKRYYHEYECNIRTRLGLLEAEQDIGYDLQNNPEQIAKDIVWKLKECVIPAFDVLNKRDAILEHRRKFRKFDYTNHNMILLEEAMIYGRRGDREQAERLFRDYYNNKLTEYRHDVEFGRRIYLHKNDRMSYKNWELDRMETVTAQQNGYVTVYDANPMHLRYLENLAVKLKFSL